MTETAFAIDPGGGEEIHFQFDPPVAFALGALAFLVVEREARGGVATHAGFGKLGEKGADVVEEFDVGGRAGTGGFSDGGLVDFVAVFELVKTNGFLIGGILGFLFAGDAEAAPHEGGLPGSGNTSENGEASEGNLDVEIVEVVQRATFELEPVLFGLEDLAARTSRGMNEWVFECLDRR